MAGGSVAREFRLLGAVEALVAGEPLQLGGPRQRALLALLLLDPGRPVSSGRLAEELWRGAPPPGAATTLRSYVSRLRSSLGGDVVLAEAGGYALAARREDVDAHRFEELLRCGREELARGAAGRASQSLHAALALWRGDALADVSADGLLAREALRLEELRLSCLEERLDADLALGRHAALVPELRALLREQPLRERLWRQLVLALYRAGRQADALAAYREARSLLDAELGLEPGEELRGLERAILRHEVDGVAPAASRHNLPAPTTAIVGRESELAALDDLLRRNRLVTLTGLGGAGKTRLALEAARRQLDAWRDGVWLADLTGLPEGGSVTLAAAIVLDVAEPSEEALLEVLQARLRGSELLLVLDNCEHVADGCAELVEALLAACPDVRVLATSRVPLAVAGEHEYALEPLPAPAEDAPAAELERSPAVRLFLERAGAVRRDLAPDVDGLATIAAICRGLDGIPLAIELAAARAKALSLDEIADRLEDRFRFLRAWQRVADPRHQAMETTMDWSYGLLGAGERDLLARLAVFAGGATLDAVTEVCLDGDEARAVDLLTRLVGASLVGADGGGRTRYRLLETVRQYAAAKLAEHPAAAAVRRRHADHYLRVAESANLGLDALGRGAQQPEIVFREQHNIRAAIDWATDDDVELGLRLVLALENFWVTQDADEGARRFGRLLERADGIDLHLRARATRDLAGCCDVSGDADRACAEYVRSGELFREAGDELGVANATFRLGVFATVYEQDDVRARRLFEESLAVFERFGDRVGALQALGNIGMIELRSGDLARGRPLVEQSIEAAREIGWHWWVSRYVAVIAVAELDAGRPDEALPQAREFLSLARVTGSRQDALYGVAILARTAAARGEVERATALWASVQALEDAPGRFGRFDREAWASYLPAGPLPSPLTLDGAVELALGG